MMNTPHACESRAAEHKNVGCGCAGGRGGGGLEGGVLAGEYARRRKGEWLEDGSDGLASRRVVG